MRKPNWVDTFCRRLVWVILYSQTTAVRFWFALSALGFAKYIDILGDNAPNDYDVLLTLAPPTLWVALLSLHSGALLFGIFTRTYSTYLLLLEGVLGTAIWSVLAASTWISIGSPGGTFAAALIAFWLLIRYPTHWERTNGG